MENATAQVHLMLERSNPNNGERTTDLNLATAAARSVDLSSWHPKSAVRERCNEAMASDSRSKSENRERFVMEISISQQ